jgi:hypothetical protein
MDMREEWQLRAQALCTRSWNRPTLPGSQAYVDDHPLRTFDLPDTSRPKRRGRMSEIGWSDLTVTPDEAAVRALRTSWNWLLGQDWSPLLFSILGDVFLRHEQQVEWLNTGTGEITTVSENEDAFREALATERADDWFMPGLVAALHEAGKRPGVGHCFTYAIYPIFAEGRYEVANFAVVPAWEHFSLSGDLHRQLSELPDGTQVGLSVVP